VPFAVEDLPDSWVKKVKGMKKKDEELEREERKLARGVVRSTKRRRASHVRVQDKDAKTLPEWLIRGTSYEDNYRLNTETNGRELINRQPFVRRVMAKVWYLNSLRTKPTTDPFKRFRDTLSELFTKAYSDELGEPVRVRQTTSNTFVYPESPSFKLELPVYERRMHRQRQLLARSGRRRR
jgi:hypothetical protein